MAVKMRGLYGLVLVLFCVMVFASCAGKKGGEDLTDAASEQQRQEEAARTKADADAKKAEQARIDAERLAREKAEADRLEAQRRAQAAAEFSKVHVQFDFDSFSLTADAMRILDSKVVWLRANPGEQITVEGHCDDRGTLEYNMALGDRRAKAVKKYLADSGIVADRIATISYGEEKPLDTSKTEEAWAKNRRAQFVIR